MNRATIVAITAAAVLAAGGIGAAALSRPDSPPIVSSSTSLSAPPPTPSPTGPPAPRPRPADPLTGGKVSDNPVIAAKVENIAAARPQVGLSLADITFVEEVEGAQTRLVAVYHTRFPKRLGPVRSARSTDVQLLPLFGKPGLVYSGANSNVQGKISRSSIVPIERSTRDHTRVAPHNVFVNLDKIANSVKAGRVSDIGWTFAARDPRWDSAEKAADPKGKVGNDTFSFDYSSGAYVVKWRGQASSDGDSGNKATTDNVVIMSVHNHPDGNRDVLGSASVMSDTVGKGKVAIYRDGRKLSGTWARKSATGDLVFTDGSGKDIPLKPGKTWVLLRG